MKMKKTVLLPLLVVAMMSSCNMQKQSPLETWKAGSANDDVFMDMTDVELLEMKNNGLSYLEVDWLYPSGNTPEQIESWANGIKSRAAKADITVWSVHLPFGGSYDISQPNDSARQIAVALNLNDMRTACRILVPTCIVIHPSTEPIADADRAAHIEASKKSLTELAARAKECNVRLLVENLPRTCLGNTSTELLDIINGIDNAAIVFDVNHLLIESQTDFIKNTKGKIESTHMSDYDRKNECHWLPGEGVIDWTLMLNNLVEADYQGPFIYEISKGDPAKTINDLGNQWKKLKEDYRTAYLK